MLKKLLNLLWGGRNMKKDLMKVDVETVTRVVDNYNVLAQVLQLDINNDEDFEAMLTTAVNCLGKSIEQLMTDEPVAQEMGFRFEKGER